MMTTKKGRIYLMVSSKPRKLPYQMADYQSRCCFLYTQFILAAANMCKHLHSYKHGIPEGP